MGNLMKYSAADVSQLLDRINKNSIGTDEYLNRVFDLHETTSNYPLITWLRSATQNLDWN